MKKIISILFLTLSAACAVFAQDSEYVITVGTNSTVIAPARKNIVYTNAWMPTNNVPQGQILYCTTNGLKYMVLVAGTTSNTAPTVSNGQTQVNGSATLIHCQEGVRRTKFLATLESDASVWIKTGTSATTNSGGEFMYLKGQQYKSESGEAISAIASADVKLVIIDL
jgi:hypothetical protein